MGEKPENVTLKVQSLKHKLAQDKVEVTIDQLVEALAKAEMVITFATKELALWEDIIRKTKQRCELIKAEMAKKEKDNGENST